MLHGIDLIAPSRNVDVLDFERVVFRDGRPLFQKQVRRCGGLADSN